MTAVSSTVAVTYGSTWPAERLNNSGPTAGPTTRANADADWFTPRYSPCRRGSLHFEISVCTDGFRNENPTTATTSAAPNSVRSDPRPGSPGGTRKHAAAPTPASPTT